MGWSQTRAEFQKVFLENLRDALPASVEEFLPGRLTDGNNRRVLNLSFD